MQRDMAQGFHVVVAALAALGIFSQPVNGQITILHSFASGANDGYLPLSDLTVSGSTLYGTTRWGGAASSNPGTVYRIDSDGSNYAVVHRFSADGSEGTNPQGNVAVVGSTIYGTTHAAGTGNRGTLFQVDIAGTGFSALHHFPSTPTYRGGYNGLVASGSNLYGMMPQGGASDDGFLFTFDAGGAGYSTLRSFNLITDGSGPEGDVILAGSKLYGMTTFAGGVLFECDPNGNNFTSLHRFGSAGDGDSPYGSLVADGSMLYGMTQLGGAFNHGTIFRINTNGTGYSILHSFSNGETPLGQDLIVSGSTLYGMTRFGGAYNRGTIFQIDAAGTGFQTLHSFSGGAADGEFPLGSLTQIGSTLYGTASQGGFTDHGVVFSFAVPEPGSFALFAVFSLAALQRRRRERAIGHSKRSMAASI